jgi:hypothetical protein
MESFSPDDILDGDLVTFIKGFLGHKNKKHIATY